MVWFAIMVDIHLFHAQQLALTVSCALFLTPVIKLVWYLELKLVAFELRLLTCVPFS